jgi:hypothetical protein
MPEAELVHSMLADNSCEYAMFGASCEELTFADGGRHD